MCFYFYCEVALAQCSCLWFPSVARFLYLCSMLVLCIFLIAKFGTLLFLLLDLLIHGVLDVDGQLWLAHMLGVLCMLCLFWWPTLDHSYCLYVLVVRKLLLVVKQFGSFIVSVWLVRVVYCLNFKPWLVLVFFYKVASSRRLYLLWQPLACALCLCGLFVPCFFLWQSSTRLYFCCEDTKSQCLCLWWPNLTHPCLVLFW